MESSHRLFCGFAAEAGTITEGDGSTPASFSANPPGSFKLCGWMNAPQTDRGLNNSLGYSIGGPEAAYRKRGARNPTLSITLRGGGALDLLTYANRDSASELPWLCFFVGVPGEWTEVYRFCKIGNIGISANESPQGEAAEIEITLQIEATAVVALSVALNPSLATLRAALGAPLFWHDVRTFSLNGTGMRKAISSFNVQVNHNLERKNERNDWGDNNPLSNTNYELLEHNLNVSGEIALHDKLSETLLTSATRSQNWGDIVLMIGDFEGTQQINFSLISVFPQTVTSDGVEAGAQLSYTVPVMAKSYALTTGGGSGGSGTGSGSGSGSG